MLKVFGVLCALSWLYWPFVVVPVLWPTEPLGAISVTLGCLLCAARGVISSVDAKP